MVASTHWLASAAGMAVLEKGGNAVDAAVAAGLVLQVVEPHLNGPGGEVPVIGFDAAVSEVFVLDGQGPAPAAATLEAFGALGLDLVPGTGLLAACVPTAFGTWMLLLERYGRLRLRDGSDLAGWRASAEAPVTLQYQGLTVCKTGPWGQGPVFLQQLALLDGFDLKAMGAGSADFIHTVTECAKLAFADREAWYGDPRATDVPLARLLSPGDAAQRRGLVRADASAELIPGSPGGAKPRLPGYAAAFGAGAGSGRSGVGEPLASAAGGLAAPELGPGDTCHLDVADSLGNLVSATPSGGWLQSSPVIPGLGVFPGTRAQMFTLSPRLSSTLAPR